MSAAAISNPAPQGEGKNARRKKNKGDTGTPVSEAAGDKSVPGAEDATGNGADAIAELPFIKDLNKNIRNVKKKIAATAKVDGIIAENPNLSLDDLLATKKINTDQKLQAERKPALQSNLRELEEELDRFKKLEDTVAQQHEAEKVALKAEHEKEIAALRTSIAQEVAANGSHQFQEKLLHLSKFLRAAASRRQDGDETAEDSRAFEGALLLVYGGDNSAVQAMENIIAGSTDLVPTVEGTKTAVSFKHLRELFAGGEDVSVPDDESTTLEASASAVTAADQTQSDPTVTHASLTEIEESTSVATGANGSAEDATTAAPETSVIDNGAANAAAESSWNNVTSSVTSGPDDWVQVHQIPRDPAETDTGLKATPAAASGTQSWAEDVPSESTPLPTHTSPPANDGFHEVHHGRPRGRGGFQGEHRGRGRGGYRGDRGDGPYRGRGGFRGDRGGEGGPRGRGRGGFRGPRGGRGDHAPPS